jgi:hypothetical protein
LDEPDEEDEDDEELEVDAGEDDELELSDPPLLSLLAAPGESDDDFSALAAFLYESLR